MHILLAGIFRCSSRMEMEIVYCFIRRRGRFNSTWRSITTVNYSGVQSNSAPITILGRLQVVVILKKGLTKILNLIKDNKTFSNLIRVIFQANFERNEENGRKKYCTRLRSSRSHFWTTKPSPSSRNDYPCAIVFYYFVGQLMRFIF